MNFPLITGVSNNKNNVDEDAIGDDGDNSTIGLFSSEVGN
jgi:hypothetical protein